MTMMTGVRQQSGTQDRSIAKVPLAAGGVSAVLYVIADAFTSISYPGYHFAHQVISELSAVGSPTADLWTKFMLGYGVLFVAFVFGAFRASRENPHLRRTAWLLFGFAATAPLWSFVPMQQRGEQLRWTDTGHMLLGALSVLLMTSIVVTGAKVAGRTFRMYSWVTAAVVLVAGIATFGYIGRMLASASTPFVGIVERISIYGFMLWMAALAIVLMRRQVYT